MKRTTFAIAGLCLILLGGVLGQWLSAVSSPSPDSKDLQTLRSAYQVIRKSYVEPVPSDSLTASSIEGMMETLDPFSMYVSPVQMEQMQETFSGSFEGIGISYELIPGPRGQDTIEVMSVVSGGPSAKAGLRAGDRIVRVEANSAVGWSHPKIQRRLKGPEGSSVSVTLRRPGHSERITTTITRATVPLETIDASYMINPRTGYIRLNRFAQTTHRELSRSLEVLKERGMRRLILDLRGNAGGLMSMAEKVADEFLVDGQLIVTARSRHEEYQGRRYATADGQWQQGPLIALVDEHSASASEIVAGALQDHDRALLVGRRTFGKGLVQQQFDLEDGSGIRLTVARFYTPAGRLLQRSEKRPRDSVTAHHFPKTSATPPKDVADSLVHRTDAGRAVVGGGGIRPDQIVPDSSNNPYLRDVEAKGIIREFARTWIDAHSDSLRHRWEGRPDAFAQDFRLPSTVYPAFLRYATERGVGTSEEALTSSTVGGTQGKRSLHRSAEDIQSRYRGEAVREARKQITTTIKAYVGQRLFGPSMWVRIQNTSDPVLVEALRSWSVAEKWADRYPVE